MESAGGDRVNTVAPVGAFTLRAFVAGSIGALIIGWGCPYATHVVKGSYMDLDFSTPGALFVFFVLVAAVNVVLGWIRKSWALQPGELILVYIMMVVASAIPTMGFSAQLVGIITAPFYFASPENHWDTLILPRVKSWLVPANRESIRLLYEGIGKERSIPWGDWLTVMLAWIPFILVVYFVMICLMVILRKQWIQRERLIYPLTELPLAMAAEECGSGKLPPILRNKVLWIGFLIPMLVGSLIGLHSYIPSVPAPRMATALQTFRNTQAISFRLSFPMLGFFYLVNLDTLFSLWFFNLLAFVASGYMKITGIGLKENLGIYGSPFPTWKHLGNGAMIVLVAAGLWNARHHLRDVVRKAFGRAPEVDDTDEALSYRTAVWGTLAGTLFIALWLHASGIPWAATAFFIASAFLIFVGLTRVVVESGMAEAVAPIIGSSHTLSVFGTHALGPTGMVGLAFTYVWSSDIRTIVITSAANSLKLAEHAIPFRRGSNRRPLFWAMMLAIVLSLASSLWYTLYVAYQKGGLTANNWFFVGGAKAPWDWVAANLNQPAKPNLAGWMITGVGGAIMLLLTYLRQTFLWWPLHPIGFCVGFIWLMNEVWLTCLLAWACKGLILRYGGMKAYRSTKPLFLGLILGQFTCNGLWIVIDAITGHQNNVIFWI